jgi:four helix bundle protein
VLRQRLLGTRVRRGTRVRGGTDCHERFVFRHCRGMEPSPFDFYADSSSIRQLDTLSVDLAMAIRKCCYMHENSSSTNRNSLLQLYRSGTSVGANIRESRYAESRKDYLHKLKIAEKELAECAYWLGILTSTPQLLSGDEAEEIRTIGKSLRRLLSQTIRTLKSNLP